MVPHPTVVESTRRKLEAVAAVLTQILGTVQSEQNSTAPTAVGVIESICARVLDQTPSKPPVIVIELTAVT